MGLAATLAPTYTVYAVDMLGFGGSSKTGRQITIADQVAAITALLDAEQVARTDFVGNSLGGWVAASFAAAHPDRTNRLILVDAAGFGAMFDGPPPVSFHPRSIEEMRTLLSILRYDRTANSRACAERALADAKASRDAQGAAAVSQGMFHSPRLEDIAGRITTPTLVIWGAEDLLFPPAIADLIVGLVKNARKVLIPQASHFPQLDNPVAFEAAVVEFLAR